MISNSNRTSNIRTLLFDLDGTILDTNELIIQSFLHVLQGNVSTPIGREHLIPHMGQPLDTQLQQFANREDVSDLKAAYRKVNLEWHDQYVKPFPHVAEVLSNLKAHGFKLGIVTTKMRMTTELGLKFTGLAEYFEPSAVITLDEVEHAKPHPEPVQKAMEALGADPETTLMIGDSTVDIQAAIAAGCRGVGVAWSLKGEAVLQNSGAAHIVHDMRDLYTLVGLERESLA